MGKRKGNLGSLSIKENGIVLSFVQEIKRNLGKELVSIYLFGSKVRRDFHQDSDIDIFILVKKKELTIIKKLAEITANYDLKYGLPLSPVLYDRFEYRKNKEMDSFFLEEVEKEGILL